MRFNLNKAPLQSLIILGITAPEVLFMILHFLKEKGSTKSDFLNLRLVSRHLVEVIPSWLGSKRITTKIQSFRQILLKSLTPKSFFISSGGDLKTKLTIFERLTWKERTLRFARRRWLISQTDLEQALEKLTKDRNLARQADRNHKKRFGDKFPELK